MNSVTERTLAKTRPLKALQARDFRALAELVYRQAGIHLADSKHALVEARLARRIRELGLSSYQAYVQFVLSAADEAELVGLLDCITTNETHFFREPRQFAFLEDVVFPRWQERAASKAMPKRLRVWSAACSSGEEPYSLAMSLLRAFPQSSGWQVEVLASDLSTRMLARAREATWPLEKAREIPQPLLRQFMLRGMGPEEGKLRCSAELRQSVHFFRHNLNQPAFDVPQDLDLIFCRNVFIYFDHKSKVRAVDALLDRLGPNGYLFIGQSETLHAITPRVRLEAPSVYCHKVGGQTR
jgi:chemotaxis protein methyltransferase CheR